MTNKSRAQLTVAMFSISLIMLHACGNGNGGSTGDTTQDHYNEPWFENGTAMFFTHYHPSIVQTTSQDYRVRMLEPGLGSMLSLGSFRAGGESTDAVFTMAYFKKNDRNYLIGINQQPLDDNGTAHEVFIQEIFDSGDLGERHTQAWFDHVYEKLFALYYYEKVFIFGLAQEPDANNDAYWWFTREIVDTDDSDLNHLGVELSDSSGDGGTWAHKWDAITPLPNSYIDYYQTCFFIHASSGNDNKWEIDCIDGDGHIYVNDHGQWANGWQNIVAYRHPPGPTGWTYIVGHRHHDSYGEYFIQPIHDNSTLNEDVGETDHGTWDNFYDRLSVFRGPDGENYLFGLDEQNDNRWFIQGVNGSGVLAKQELDNGYASAFYDYMFPIEFDQKKYSRPDMWMKSLAAADPGFGTRVLASIALPGSHDSGMSEAHYDYVNCYPKPGSDSCNTVTQDWDIHGQLMEGARYFDIRPKLDEGDLGSMNWPTGHTTEGDGYQSGCLGEDRDSIVAGLDSFFEDTDHQEELVILNVGHCTRTPGSSGKCTETQFQQLAETLVSTIEGRNNLKDRVIKFTSTDEQDAMKWTLNDLVHKGNIILVFEGTGSPADPASGIMEWGKNYWVYGNYSDTLDFNTMADDQNCQMSHTTGCRYYPTHPFLLSWTLTLDSTAVANCDNPIPEWRVSIRDFAHEVEPKIERYLRAWVANPAAEGWHQLSTHRFPSILHVDVFNRVTTNAAIYLNENYDQLEDTALEPGTCCP